MDLLRLALERAATASHAIQVITELLGQFGQGGGCGHEHRNFTYHNSFIVADRGEAYVLETAGREWAVEQVTGGARTISNGLTIPSFAEGRSQLVRTHFSRCRVRQALTQRLSNSATTPADLMAALRYHGTSGHGTSGHGPDYSILTGAMAAPCMHAGGVAAASQTTASWVAQLGSGSDAHWVTATAAPCTSLFKPVHVGEPLDLGPTPTDRFDQRCLWWRHERLHRTCMRDPDRLLPLFAPERDEVEARWLADPPTPLAAFAEADSLLARWTETVRAESSADHRPRFVRRYWSVRDRRAQFPSQPAGTGTSTDTSTGTSTDMGRRARRAG
jgi:hypothetical protein